MAETTQAQSVPNGAVILAAWDRNAWLDPTREANASKLQRWTVVDYWALTGGYAITLESDPDGPQWRIYEGQFTTPDVEPRGGYLLIRSEDWAHLYDLGLDPNSEPYRQEVAALARHFDGAYIVGEPAGEVFHVPAEGEPIATCHVATELSAWDDNDYATRSIKIMAGTDVLATVSHRVDGRA